MFVGFVKIARSTMRFLAWALIFSAVIQYSRAEPLPLQLSLSLENSLTTWFSKFSPTVDCWAVQVVVQDIQNNSGIEARTEAHLYSGIFQSRIPILPFGSQEIATLIRPSNGRADILHPSPKYLSPCKIALMSPSVMQSRMQSIKAKLSAYQDYFLVWNPSQSEHVATDTLCTGLKHCLQLPHQMGEFPSQRTEMKINKINLSGRHLRLAGISVPPLVVFAPEDKDKVVSGTFHAFFDTASKFYNFSYNINSEYFRQRGPGKQDPKTGKWSGVIGGITRGECDLTFMGHQKSRYDFMHFSTPLFFDETIFVTALPQVSVKWYAMFGPFSPNVWLALLITTVVMAVTYYLIMRYRVTQSSPEPNLIYKSWSLPVNTLLEQDSSIPAAVRPLALLWMFVTVILAAGFKDQLVSFLTFPELEFVPNNFQDLDSHASYKIIVDGLLISFRLNNSQDATIGRLLNRFQVERNTAYCVTSAAIQKKIVCLGYKPMLSVALASELTLNYQFSPVVESVGLLPHVHVSVAIRRNMDIIPDWETVVGWYRDAGMYERSKLLEINHFKSLGKQKLQQRKDTDVYQRLTNILASVSKTVSPLKIKHFYGILGVYAALILIALLIFLSEVVGSCTRDRVCKLDVIG